MTGRRWVGATSLPTENVRRRAGWPNGILVVGPDRVQIRDRFGSVRTKKPIELDADSANVTKAYPIRNRRGFLAFRGVGITTADGLDYFFNTRNGTAIRAALREAGFTVTDEVENPKKLKYSIP